MKRFLPYIVLLSFISLASCQATYFYSTLNSPNDYVEKVENGDFLLETDSLWIAYCFKGEGAPMQITIYNKLNEPLHVDWERSAMVIDGMAHSYTGKETPFQGSLENFSVSHNTDNNTYTYSAGNFGGIIESPNRMSFVFPETMVSNTPIRLNPDIKEMETKSYENIQINDGYNQSQAQRITFKESDSPLKFKSYLTLYYKPDKPMYFIQDFYMEELIKTHAKPSKFGASMIDRGDFFYTIKPANNNYLYGTLAVVGLAGVIIMGASIDTDTSIDYDPPGPPSWW